MSSQIRRKNTSVIELLQKSPHLVPFFQAVRLLERAAIKQSTKHDKKILGQFNPPSQEPIRFSNLLSLTFPGADIAKIELDSSKLHSLYKMTVNFMGLTGTQGVLPFHYTELMFDRVKQRDHGLQAFFDLFNHRTLSLFYAAGTKYRLPLAYERYYLEPRRHNPLDLHTHLILSLIGLGTDHQLDQLRIPHQTLAYFAGLLSQRTRNARGLQQMLQYYFDVPVNIEEFIGEWQDLIDDVRTRMPFKDHPLGQNACLGRSAILGSRGWFAQGKIRIRLGPLNQAQFNRFAPGTDTLKRMDELVRLYAGTEFNVEYLLQVAKRYLPKRVQLKQLKAPTMGWDTWLSTDVQTEHDLNHTLDIKVSSRRLQQS